ncbi:hypothetical protein RHSIM_Rhsim04G0131700 [Rhododendron simsii]|uniref:Josephin-like protein n=1 Tax=Rhododendron simsii TaxID=118357 RepID=A0A834H3S5_RHOSS|nr:hypothetical protein RHSIM_Rhsim04G0131700 [Rhododendron simsii]
MSSKVSKRVGFSPDVSEKPPPTFHKNGCGTKVGGKKRRLIGILSFRATDDSSFSPVGILRRIGARVARALRGVPIGRRSSCKVSSSSLARSRSYAEMIDSHRAEAVEDCIEFLNSSSSSLRRSFSVSANSSC